MDKTIFLFDVDGVLVEEDQDHTWLNILPRLYAKKEGISVEKAKKYWKREYKKLEGKLVWSDINFWSKRYGFDLVKYFKVPKTYPDATAILKKHGKNSIIVTANPYELIPIRTKKVGHLVKKICSTFDFGLPKEDTAFFLALIKKEKLVPENCIFVDDRIKNVESARRAGITAFQINRKLKGKKKGVISSLKELM